MIKKIKMIIGIIVFELFLLNSITACSNVDTPKSLFGDETETGAENEEISEIITSYITSTVEYLTAATDLETNTATAETSPAVTSVVTITITDTDVPVVTEPAASIVTTTSAAQLTEEPAEIVTYAPQIESTGIILVSFNSNLVRNENATITVKGKPNTEYTIKVYYSSGESKAEGLEKKISDANGIVSWTWHVGGRTSIGEKNKRIEISGGGEKYTTTFAVID